MFEKLLLFGPAALFLEPIEWVFKQLTERANETMLDEKPIVSELSRLESELMGGRISEDDFELQETALLERLEWIAAQRKAQA